MRFARTAMLCVAMIAAGMQGAAAEGDDKHVAPLPSPYAGLESRQIKSLSDRQIDDLRNGRGMGLALAAELNFYPGPLHVLELADRIALSDDQRAAVAALFDAMKAETIPIGERIIADEAQLDRLFAEKRITPALLQAITARIGAAQGQLRAAHLGYHLRVREMLSSDQIARYVAARGYGAEGLHGAGAH